MSKFICCCCGKDIQELRKGFVLEYELNSQKIWFYCRNIVELQKWIVNLSNKQNVTSLVSYKIYPTKLKLLDNTQIEQLKIKYKDNHNNELLNSYSKLTALV